MTIIVEEASDADIPRAVEIEVAAYASGPGTNSLLFPEPFPTDRHSTGRANQIIAMRKNDPTTRFFKAVDEESGEQIAFQNGTSTRRRNRSHQPPNVLSHQDLGSTKKDVRPSLVDLFGKKEDIMGNKPYIYLYMLHTDPKYQRRGAASALIRRITQKADEFSLPVYLESSPKAHSLYGKHGFQDVELFEVHLEYSGEVQTQGARLMIREPVKPSSDP